MRSLLTLGLAATAAVAVSADPQDARALLALKSAISNWDTVKGSAGFTGWDTQDPCPGQGATQWVGVECDYTMQPPRVRSLNLAQLGPHTIQGTLPADLDYLNAATYITLDNQDFSGPLPSSWGANGGFAALQSMSIALTKISGPLPAQWATSGGYQKMHTLTLYGNQLDGELPAEWGNPNAFPMLHTFTVSDNKLSGALPNAWATGFQKIQQLNLARNRFTGRLPSAWAFPVLEELELEGNQLSGPVGQAEKWPAQMPSLKKLDLSGNALTGAIPATWDNLHASQLVLFPGNKGLCGNITPKLAKTPDGTWNRVDVTQGQGLTKTSTGGYTFDPAYCQGGAPAPAAAAAMPPVTGPEGAPLGIPTGLPPQPLPAFPLAQPPQPAAFPGEPARPEPLAGPPQPLAGPPQPQDGPQGPGQPRVTVNLPAQPPALAPAGVQPSGLPEPPALPEALPQPAQGAEPPRPPQGSDLPQPPAIAEPPQPEGPLIAEPPRPSNLELPMPPAIAGPPSIERTAAQSARLPQLPRPFGPP